MVGRWSKRELIRKMRIIVATGLNAGDAEYRNMGDVAMLQAAAAKLLNIWPDAHIDILTDSPSNLARFCPGTSPLSRKGCACWLKSRVLLGRYHKFLPERLSVKLSKIKTVIGLYWPSILDRLTLLKLRSRDPLGLRDSLIKYIEAVEQCDLMVVCGSGGFADSCREWNFLTLSAIGGALERGKTVAMFGQGVGPLSDPVVLSCARRIFPKVDLIGLRGNEGGREMIARMGVNPAKVLTTGDEAIELAYEERSKEPGNAVGINLRVASYAEVTSDYLNRVRSVLQNFARDHQAPLVPIPIASHDYADDRKTIRRLLEGFDDSPDDCCTLDTPQKLFEQTARCRIVVTGAYHAAVFALAQGIPVVCLYNSAYYLAKFNGLKGLFGCGSAVVNLGETNLSNKLAEALEECWNSADRVRSPLLKAARRQIEMRKEAYFRVKEMLEERSGKEQRTYDSCAITE